jgi:hypothetical protein
MGFKVRGYTREVTQEKVRDYSLFAIACEGTVTEPGYFRPFDGIKRIMVDIIEGECDDGQQENGCSSPSKVLERVKSYIDDNQLSPEHGDSLWCVIDVDRWPQEQIEELHAFCEQKDNWHLVISNPSIEIWLLYHTQTDLSGFGIKTAKDAKRVLDKVAKYYYFKYLPLMPQAIENARNADSNPDSYMPEPLKTKVYQLAQALYDRIGKRSFDAFIAKLPQIEQELLAKKKK